MALFPRRLPKRHFLFLGLISVGPIIYYALMLILIPFYTWEGQQVKISEPDSYQGSLTQVENTFPERKVNLTSLSDLYQVRIIKCSDLFAGRPAVMRMGLELTRRMGSWPRGTNDLYLKTTKNCSDFVQSRGYITSSVTPEEKNFPVAYSLVVNKDVEMVERLLRAIYRPQNVYCIHVDRKAKRSYYEAVKAIAKCFKNVILPSRRVFLWRGTFSALEANLICMKELWKYKSWKFFINLTGREFPLASNLDLVRMLLGHEMEMGYGMIKVDKFGDGLVWKGTGLLLGITPVHGLKHLALNRDVVDYILHDSSVGQIQAWCKMSEVLFSAYINRRRGPGIAFYEDILPQTNDEPKAWEFSQCLRNQRKSDTHILGTANLPEISRGRYFFASQFHLAKDPLAISCLEERLFNRTKEN